MRYILFTGVIISFIFFVISVMENNIPIALASFGLLEINAILLLRYDPVNYKEGDVKDLIDEIQN